MRYMALPAAVVTVLIGCGPSAPVDAPPPVRVADTAADSLPPLPPSLLDAPITYDLSPAFERLEAAVPKTFGDLEARRRSEKNRRVKPVERLVVELLRVDRGSPGVIGPV